MIPRFEPNTGQLPPGEHWADWEEFEERFAWNDHRRWLLGGLRRLALHLREIGCSFFLIDGSFVSAKEFPSDYDACCDYSGMDVMKLDQTLMGSGAEMKLKYLGEVFPEHYLAMGGYTFREFFQTDRDGLPKGIVRLNLESIK